MSDILLLGKYVLIPAGCICGSFLKEMCRGTIGLGKVGYSSERIRDLPGA